MKERLKLELRELEIVQAQRRVEIAEQEVSYNVIMLSYYVGYDCLTCLLGLFYIIVYTRRIDGRMPNRLPGMPCKSIH